VVAETENTISLSHDLNLSESVDLPAPEGEDKMITSPLRILLFIITQLNLRFVSH